MIEHLANIEVRLTTFIDKLNVRDLKYWESDKTKLSTENWSRILPDEKLLKIVLPMFSGNMYERLTFKDYVLQHVYDNSNLPDVQRLQYIFSELKGDAVRIENSISVPHHNYKIALSLLDDTYHNIRNIFSHILSNLCQTHLF